MTNKRDDFDPKAYNPEFERSFLKPKYWGTWLAVFSSVLIALLPLSVHQWLAKVLASRLVKSKANSVNNVKTNLALCFPHLSAEERDQLVYKTLYTAGVFTLRFGLVSLRSPEWLQSKCDFVNAEQLFDLTKQNQKVILLVPHSWSIDIPAVLLASKGLPVSAMAKRQKNPVTDWLMHRQRVQYGGRVYERSGGIKPFIKSIKDGYLGYYLPDQDHGAELSEFVDFFATTKATLPGLTKLAKLSKSKVVPTFASLDPETGRFSIEFMPPLTLQETESEDARSLNEAVEYFVSKSPEQYMWTLRLLRTQTDDSNPYREMREHGFIKEK
ncbi:lauroyl-Kdo(2)-lipid IV(A) myristoyltransferase [Vibrio natriegens]|uniref:lauroyl-Kdo(2)-lipid IV(A) myristoyltransferase n=1 Tax=Vibrio natriegens TaxID=691 RepID=UPI0021E8FD04|nr:lauroyl-Kdo(2)-lipid IV(A) myristoyltransferase [Vibrio natriegens]UYI47295.1 lauroyl-Kdo(2)-lipid IV(A) myristoyltransferase [Vibrio natriegens]